MGHQSYLFVRNLFVVLGATFFLIFFNPIIKFIVTSSWPQTEGVVASAQATPEKSGLINIHRVRVIFEYRVGDQVYHGNRINYGIAADTYLFEQFAKAVVDRYPKGKTVAVYYNPENPADEIVERSPMGGFSIIWIFFTISFFTLAIIITARRKESLRAREQTKVGSLRERSLSGEDVFTDHYPSAVYEPSSPMENRPTKAVPRRKPKKSEETVIKDHYPEGVYKPPTSSNKKTKT